MTKLKQSRTVEDLIATFDHLAFQTEGMSDAFSKSFLSVASRMRFGPMSSWFDLIVGWRILKQIKNQNKLYLLKTGNPPLSNPPLHTEGETSSHSHNFYPHHFQHDLRLPRVDVTKFEGSNPTEWVTQIVTHEIFTPRYLALSVVKCHISVSYTLTPWNNLCHNP